MDYYVDNNDKNELMVSVIIPVFNVKGYLREALDSVITQTYKNLEIIIIDDGSSDGSELICDEYAEKDPRIQVFHQSHQGVSSCRNKGLDCASGNLITFLDSDDAFHPDMVRRLVEVKITQNADIAECGFVRCRTQGHMTIPVKKRDDHSLVILDRENALRALIIREVSNYSWDKVFSRKCFDGIRYPVGFNYEDVDTTYRILNNISRLVKISDPLVMHRSWSGSITGFYSLKSAKDRDRAYGHVADFVKANTPEIFSDELKQKICTSKLSIMMGTYARSGKDAELYRENILKAAEDVDLSQCNLRIKGEFFLLSHYPRLLMTVYAPLRYINKKRIVLKEKISFYKSLH